MKLEDQCCSLELAKKLKELGVKQKSLYIWVETANFGMNVFSETFSFDLEMYGSVTRLASAFTVAELGEMLPVQINNMWLRMWKDTSRHGNYGIAYEREDGLKIPGSYPRQRGHTEANARATMLVYLLENGLMTLEREAS